MPGAEGEVPQEHDAREDGGVFLGKHARRGNGKQAGCGRRQPRSPESCRSDVEQQAAHHRHGRHQVRAADDIGHRLRAKRMHGPQRGSEEGGPGAVEDAPGEREHQANVAGMQQEIDPVISRQVVAVSQDGVIEEKRCRGHRPVKPVARGRPPVVLGENQPQVLRAGLADARVLLQDGAHIERRPRIERIGVGQQRDRAQAGAQAPGTLEESRVLDD